MSQELVKTDDLPVAVGPEAEAALAVLCGDISKLTTEERAKFLVNMAKALGLNPLSKPIDLFPNQNGKLVPYFNKGATDQLRGLHRVNVEILDRGFIEPDVYMVKAKATMPSGRCDESIATVFMKGKVGDDRANQYMKCETKAKRRVTLSILGLNFLDELEVQTIPAFQQQTQVGPKRLEPGSTFPTTVEVINEATGEITEIPSAVAPEVTPEPVQPKPTVAARKLPAVPPVAVKK